MYIVWIHSWDAGCSVSISTWLKYSLHGYQGYVLMTGLDPCFHSWGFLRQFLGSLGTLLLNLCLLFSQPQGLDIGTLWLNPSWEFPWHEATYVYGFYIAKDLFNIYIPRWNFRPTKRMSLKSFRNQLDPHLAKRAWNSANCSAFVLAAFTSSPVACSKK